MVRKNFISLWWLGAFFAAFPAFAQKTLVVDASNGESMAYASIFFPEFQRGAICDSLGYFEKPSDILTLTKVKIALVGYRDLSTIYDPSSPPLQLALEPLDNGLKEVVVSGTMKAMRKLDSPVPVEVFTPRFFQRNPTPSLFDAVQMVNGVRPQLQCNVCNTGDIHINGMEGPYTMVLIDGMPIVGGLSTVYGLSGIPNSILQRLEVVKGPAAALYGSEAMGGLINVITKDPPEKGYVSIDINGTTYRELNSDLGAAWRLGKARGLLGANYFHYARPFDINGDLFTDVTLQKRLSLFNKWRFSDHFSLAGRYLTEDRYGGELRWRPEYRGSDSIYGESILTKRGELMGNYRLPSVKHKIQLAFSANLHRQDSYYGDVPYMAEQAIGFIQATWELPVRKKHARLLGVGWRYTYYEDNTPVTTAGPQHIRLPGLFAQDEWKIGPEWTLLSGLRFDYDRRHGLIFSPRLNLKYGSSEGAVWRFSTGSGFRVANVFSEDHAALTGGRLVEFAEALDPERSWNANLNYSRLHAANFGFVTIDATLFYTRFFNKIIADYDIDPEKIIYANLKGYAENLGFSLNSDWNFTNGLKGIAGITALEVRQVENGLSEWQIQTPRLTGNWQLSYSAPGIPLTVDYNGFVYSPMRLPVFPDDYRPSQSPWFSIHNIQVTWSNGKGIEFYGGVKNLFNFYPREDVIMRPFDPFDQEADDPVNNPKGYTFDPSYNYAPVQRIRGFAGMRVRL